MRMLGGHPVFVSAGEAHLSSIAATLLQHLARIRKRHLRRLHNDRIALERPVCRVGI